MEKIRIKTEVIDNPYNGVLNTENKYISDIDAARLYLHSGGAEAEIWKMCELINLVWGAGSPSEAYNKA